MRSTSCPELQQDLLYWWRWPGFGGTFTKPFEQHPDLICHTDFPKSGRSASHQTFPIGPPNPTFLFLFANAVTKGGCNHARLSATQDVTFMPAVGVERCRWAQGMVDRSGRSSPGLTEHFNVWITIYPHSVFRYIQHASSDVSRPLTSHLALLACHFISIRRNC
jgi:hypothetical protein